MNEKTRRATATFGGDRFPIPDRKHARLALQMLPRAKNISAGEEGQVRRRAQRMLAAGKALQK